MLTGRERLVTIVGLGGTGKTRLAVAAAEGLLPAFEGGVWLVPLAGVRDPGALLPTIASALDVADASGPLEDAVARRLHARPRCSCSTTSSSSSTRAVTVASCSSARRARGCW